MFEKFGRVVKDINENVEKRIQEELIFDNCIGFIGAKGGVGTSSLVVSTALDLASKNKTVCIIDSDVFKMSVASMLDCKEENKEDQGLVGMLSDSTCDIREQIFKSAYDRVYVLTRSLMDKFEDFMDFTDADFKRVFKEVKDIFDFVLVDIPFNPCSEFCIYSLKYIDRGFFVWEDNIECYQNTFDIKYFLTYAADIDVGKINNIIINKRRLPNLMDKSAGKLQGVAFKTEGISDLSCNLFCEMPFIGSMQKYINLGKPYYKFGENINGVFLENVDKISRYIMYL